MNDMPKVMLLNKYHGNEPPSKLLSLTWSLPNWKARPKTPKVKIVSVSVSNVAVYFLYCWL